MAFPTLHTGSEPDHPDEIVLRTTYHRAPGSSRAPTAIRVRRAVAWEDLDDRGAVRFRVWWRTEDPRQSLVEPRPWPMTSSKWSAPTTASRCAWTCSTLWLSSPRQQECGGRVSPAPATTITSWRSVFFPTGGAARWALQARTRRAGEVVAFVHGIVALGHGHLVHRGQDCMEIASRPLRNESGAKRKWRYP